MGPHQRHDVLAGSTAGVVITQADLATLKDTGTLLAPLHIVLVEDARVFFLIVDSKAKLFGKAAWLLDTQAMFKRSEPVTVKAKRYLKLHFEQVMPMHARLIPVTSQGTAVSIGFVSHGPLNLLIQEITKFLCSRRFPSDAHSSSDGWNIFDCGQSPVH